MGRGDAAAPWGAAGQETAVESSRIGFVGAGRGAQQCGENGNGCRVFYSLGQSLPQSGAARVFPAGIADYGPFFLA